MTRHGDTATRRRGDPAARLVLFALATALSSPAATFYVTVTGIGGEPEYEVRFKMVADDIEHTLKSASPDAKVITLQKATREQVRSTLAQIAKEAKPEDALVLMLIGHGAYDGVDYKINLVGPDLSAVDLATLLDRVPPARQLVVNMTSASGGSMDVLRKANRIVITATKTGTEKNATVFARFWAEALKDPAADTDKNDVISALEAFRYAEQKTAAYYETNKRLATEHALLEDTGKGQGVKAPAAENGQGLLASRFPVVRRGSTAAAAASPEKRALVAKKDALEQQIDQLKYQKAAMPAAQYKQQLAALLLELAKTQEEIDK